jgi:hypothetical protein
VHPVDSDSPKLSPYYFSILAVSSVGVNIQPQIAHSTEEKVKQWLQAFHPSNDCGSFAAKVKSR